MEGILTGGIGRWPVRSGKTVLVPVFLSLPMAYSIYLIVQHYLWQSGSFVQLAPVSTNARFSLV